MIKPALLKQLHSAGGVIFRKANETCEIALIAIKGKSAWTLPKGIIDKGEKPETTAVREIEEETGLKGKIIDILGEKSYWFYQKEENVKYRKTVNFFLIEHIGGEIGNNCPEVDEARWETIEAAFEMLSYKTDREILEQAKEKLAAHGHCFFTE